MSAGRPALDRAYRLAGLLLGNAHEAEDAVQDALVVAWQSFDTLRDPAKFGAWLDRIVVNGCRGRLRRRGIVRFIPMATDLDPPDGDPFQALLERDALLSGVGRLTPDERIVVVLRFWADLPLDEIADRLDWPLGTVKSRLHRAVRRLPRDPRPRPNGGATMIDQHELEERLRAAFRSGSLPVAPASLIGALEATPDAPVVGSRRRRGSWPRVLAVAAVLLVGGAVALSVGNRGPNPLPLPSPQPSPVASAAESTTGRPPRLAYDPQWTADVPFSADRLSAAVAIVQQRIDATGMVGVRVATDAQARIVVDLPAGIDPDPIRRLVGQMGYLEFVTVDGATVEVGSHLDPAAFPAIVDSTDVVDVSILDDQTGQPTLQMTLREPGAGRLADYTATHIGSMFAVVLDRTVVAAPVIQSEIPGGDVQISFGSSTPMDPAELARLATIIRHGPLPVALVETANGPAPSSSAPAAADPPIRCEAPIPVEGPHLECEPAVRDALAILPVDHPPIAQVTFNHSCHDVIANTVPDCAVQLSGTVEVTFVDGSRPVHIAVSLGERATIIPNLPIPPPSGTAVTLNAAIGDIGCDTIRVPYRGVVIHVDPAAADAVWAITDTGNRLRTFWASGFQGGTAIDPVVYDANGLVVAREGTVIDVPDEAWPNLAGYFVCPSQAAIYVFAQAAP